jgi:hypothetical protein
LLNQTHNSGENSNGEETGIITGPKDEPSKAKLKQQNW